MKPNINRRDFLKILTMFSCLFMDYSINRLQPSLLNDKLIKASEDKKGNTAQNKTNSKPNIIIILLDTLSARHMSLYGYSRETTPNISRLASRATVFHHHYSTGNFTTPGTASLLTGLYPWNHRALNLGGTIIHEYEKNVLFNFLNGYSSYAFTHNALALNILLQFKEHISKLYKAEEVALFGKMWADSYFSYDYNAAFLSEEIIKGDYVQKVSSSLFYTLIDRSRLYSNLQEQLNKLNIRYPKGPPNNIYGIYYTLEDTIDWIQNQLLKFTIPYLSYFHLLPPHDPYLPTVDFLEYFNDQKNFLVKPKTPFPEVLDRSVIDKQRRSYDQYIAFVDSEVGRLFEFIHNNLIDENTYIILTSDHGELFERGTIGHVNTLLYESLIHIPLIIWKPGQLAQQNVYSRTTSIDLLPTLLKITGNKIPEDYEGSILPTFEGCNDEIFNKRAIFALEAKQSPKFGIINKATLAMLKNSYKLIHYFGYDEVKDGYELYDLENDPEELENLYFSQTAIAIDLKNELLKKEVMIRKKPNL
jgi:arylsulfatase A-like enzyme